MKKKVLATLLATSLVAACLAGCGNSGDTTGGAPADNNAAADNTAAPDKAPADNTAADNNAAADTAADPVANLIAATTGTVDLSVWASELDQDLTTELLDNFKAEYSDVDFNITLGAESESKAKDDVLADVEAAPDVYAFADDQLNDLVTAGALQPVSNTYTYDVQAMNSASTLELATMNGQLYAYPMTADNGYFMFYDASVFSEDDVKSLDKMVEVAKEAGKQIAIDVSNGWYIYAFFQAAGYDLTLNDDGSNSCTWNASGATDVAQAIIDLYASNVVVDLDDAATVTGITEGTISAAINGVWNAEAAEKAWGEGYAAAKLPTFNVAGKDLQLASFSGGKLVGVNPYSKNIGWAMLLAEYLTNEESQIARFEQRGLGPTNVNAAASDAVQSNPALAAFSAQYEFARPQRVGGNFWTPAETLGDVLAKGNPDGTDLQTLLDTAVEGICAPVAE